MLHIALRMLLGDRLKYLSLIGGVAFATLLMAQQAAIFAGLTYQTGAPVRNVAGDFDLWVMDPEVEFSEEYKPLPDTTPDRLRGIDGVAWAVPHYKARRSARLPDGSLKAISLVGLDDATLLGGPLAMVEGELRNLREDRGVLLDAAQLETNFTIEEPGGRRPLRVGDTFSINDQSVKVVGIFRQERSFFWEPVVYTTYSRALAMAPPERKLLSHALVKAKPGVSPEELARRISDSTGLKALTRGGFIELTALYVLFKTGILINFSISVGLGLVIGILVSAQTFYTFVLDHLRHFGVLKAIGIPGWQLVAMVAVQVLTVGLIGFGIGIGLASLFGLWFRDVGPGAFLLTWHIPVFVGVAVLLVSLGAGLLSLRKVLTLEAAIVFRG